MIHLSNLPAGVTDAMHEGTLTHQELCLYCYGIFDKSRMTEHKDEPCCDMCKASFDEEGEVAQ